MYDPLDDLPYVRCPLNAPGPFYTCGNCMACGAPEAEAPELLAPLSDKNYTTYFVRQPTTPAEIEHACKAMRVCCIDDLRYGGTDPEIIRRLGNVQKTCDYLLVDGNLTFVGPPGPQPTASDSRKPAPPARSIIRRVWDQLGKCLGRHEST